MKHPPAEAASLALFTTGYLAAVGLSEHSYGTLAVPSPFWLPDSVLVCALLLAPRAQWWMFLVAMWPIRLIMGAAPGTPAWFLPTTVAIDMVKGAGTAWLLQRILRQPVRLRAPREFLIFLGVAAVLFPALSAVAAAFARRALGDVPLQAGLRWFLGDALAQTVVTPTILYWCERSSWRRDVRAVELLLLGAGLTGTLLFLFVFEPSSYSMRLAYLPVPLLIWAAVRMRPFDTANAIALVAFVAIVGAANGAGVFAGATASQALVSIQIVLLLLGVSLLPLALLMTEHAALREREIGLTGRLLDDRERERGRIARELHDDLGQRMAVLKVGIDRFALDDALPTEARQRLLGFSELARDICGSLETVTHTLHPVTLDIVGLERAIRRVCRDFSDEHGIRVQFVAWGVPSRVASDVSLCLFRVAQEALLNVASHSGASLARVELTGDGERLTLRVADDGRGFDVEALEASSGLGLASMRERLRNVGGHLVIRSETQGGSEICADVPAVHPESA